jgi:hypothetical protein
MGFCASPLRDIGAVRTFQMYGTTFAGPRILLRATPSEHQSRPGTAPKSVALRCFVARANSSMPGQLLIEYTPASALRPWLGAWYS